MASAAAFSAAESDARDAAEVAAHQAAHPERWSDELKEATRAWQRIIRAIRAGHAATLSRFGLPPPLGVACAPGAAEFLAQCAADASLGTELDLVCNSGYHPVLMQWLHDLVHKSLTTVVVPDFWSRYRQFAARGPAPGVGTADKRGARVAHVAELLRAVERICPLMEAHAGLLDWAERRGWRPPTAEEAAKAAEAGESEGGRRSAGGDVRISLQTSVRGGAPSADALNTWMAAVWRRFFVELTSPHGSRVAVEVAVVVVMACVARDVMVAAMRAQDMNDDDDDDDDDDGMGLDDDSEGEEGDPMDVTTDPPDLTDCPLATQLREFSTRLQLLEWRQLTEGALSAMLHSHLRAWIDRHCAKTFDTPLLRRAAC